MDVVRGVAQHRKEWGRREVVTDVEEKYNWIHTTRGESTEPSRKNKNTCTPFDLVPARPGAVLALLVPLLHPLRGAEGAVVLGVLLALLGVLTLLSLAPVAEGKKDRSERNISK